MDILGILANQLDSKTRLMFVPNEEKVARYEHYSFDTIPLLDTHRQTDRETDRQAEGQECCNNAVHADT